MRRWCSLFFVVLLAAAATGCPPDGPKWDLGSSADAAPPDHGKVDAPSDQRPDSSQYCPVFNLSTGAKPSPVQGVEEAGGAVCAYYGVPYAEAPTGPLRWKRPQKKFPWNKTLIADKRGLSCMTYDPDPVWLGQQGEDCLNVNIWAPKTPPKTPAPVLVWIGRGREFRVGGLLGPWDSGRTLAEKHGLVVVMVNWRRGALGFFSHPALGADSGNFGLLDQQAALQWVKDNIKTFGGDPNRVTLYGGGLIGGISVCTHLVLDSSSGLFHRAIMETGFCPRMDANGKSAIMTKSQAEDVGKALATALGCETATDVVGCMRGKTAKEVNEALQQYADWRMPPSAKAPMWSPVEDGTLIKGQPAALIKAGTIASKVPLLIGGARDDGLLFVRWRFPGVIQITKQAWVNAVNTSAPSSAAKIIAMYDPAKIPLPTGTNATAAAYAMKDTFGDSMLHCPQRRAAGWLAAAGVPVYRFHQSLEVSACTTNASSLYPCPPATKEPFLGTTCVSFCVFAFHTPQKDLFDWRWDFNAKEEAMSQAVMGYWARFAATGDPNGGGAQTWPKYDATKDEVLDFGDKPKVVTGLRKKQCDLWDSLL